MTPKVLRGSCGKATTRSLRFLLAFSPIQLPTNYLSGGEKLHHPSAPTAYPRRISSATRRGILSNYSSMWLKPLATLSAKPRAASFSVSPNVWTASTPFESCSVWR